MHHIVTILWTTFGLVGTGRTTVRPSDKSTSDLSLFSLVAMIMVLFINSLLIPDEEPMPESPFLGNCSGSRPRRHDLTGRHLQGFVWSSGDFAVKELWTTRTGTRCPSAKQITPISRRLSISPR